MSQLQASVLAAFLVLLLAPRLVPDPLGVGPALSWTLICVLPAMVVLACHWRRGWPRTFLDPFIGVYLAVIAATSLVTFDSRQTSLWVVSLLANLGIYYAVVAAVRQRLLSPALMLAIFMLGISVLQAIAADFHFEVGALARPIVYDRPSGWGGYPELGLLATIAFAIALAASQETQPWWSRLATLAIAGVTLLELAFLYSRQSWISVAAICVTAGVVGALTKRLRSTLAIAVLVVTVGAVMIASNASMKQLAQDLVGLDVSPSTRQLSKSTPSMRFDIWRRTVLMIEDNWLAGVGLGNFQGVYEPNYNPEYNNDGRRGVHAHNLWLQQTAELGVVGGTVYLGLWAAVFVSGWRRSRQSMVDRAFFYIITAIAFRSVTDNMFFSTGDAPARLHTLTWCCFGVIAARQPATVTAVDKSEVTAVHPRWRRLAWIGTAVVLLAGEAYGYQQLREYAMDDLPVMLRSVPVQIVLIALYNAALAMFVVRLSASATDAPAGSPLPPVPAAVPQRP